MNQELTTTQKIEVLDKLVQSAFNDKILWEEVQIILKKADKLQAEILKELEKQEKIVNTIPEVQTVFAMRELVWDKMIALEKRILAIQENTFKSKKDQK